MAIVNGTQLPNAIGTIVSGPVGAGATRFWQVNYANGVDGWTTESLIEKLAPDAGLPGPLAWWSFSENTGATTADSSGQGNTGTLVGAPTWVPGKVGSGLSFDGVNDYVLAPHSASLNVQNPPLSLSAWVYPRSNSTVFRSIFAKNYTYYLYANVSSMYCGTGGGTFAGFNGPDPSWVCHPTLLPLNTWTWVTANYDGTQFTLYKGIIEVASRPGIGAIYASDGGFQIGASQWGEYFDGVIDDVLVYPRQLSVAEIAAFVAGPQG